MDQSNKKRRLGKGLSELLGEARANIYTAPRSPAPQNFPVTEVPTDSAETSQDISSNEQLATLEDNIVSLDQENILHDHESPTLTLPQETDSALTSLPIEMIEPNPRQPRKNFDSEHLNGLADSIKEFGMIQPIIVTKQNNKEEYLIIAGERRWRAAQIAGLKEVPVSIKDDLKDERLLQVSLIENIQRQDLSPLEEAQCYVYLMDQYDLTQSDIAASIGKSRSYVANIVRMLNLNDYVKGLLNAGDISIGHAKILAGLPEAEGKQLAEEVVTKGMNVRALEKRLGKENNINTSKLTPTMSREKDEDTLALEADLSAALGLSVAIQQQKAGKGQLTIHYNSLESLDDLCKRLCMRGE